MGWWSSVRDTVAAPIVAPARAVSNIAQGGNVFQNVGSGVIGGSQLTFSNQLLSKSTGDVISKSSTLIPLIGGDVKSIYDISSKAQTQTLSSREIEQYGVSSGKVGAVAYGGTLAVGSLGVGGAAGAAALSSKLLSGGKVGAGDIASLTGYGGEYGDYSGLWNALSKKSDTGFEVIPSNAPSVSRQGPGTGATILAPDRQTQTFILVAIGLGMLVLTMTKGKKL